MILLKDGKLLLIDDREDDHKVITVVRTQRDEHRIKDQIFTLYCGNDGYYFKCTQSPFSDDSGLGNRLHAAKTTAGSAIAHALDRMHIYANEDYKVFNNGIEITKDIIRTKTKITIDE